MFERLLVVLERRRRVLFWAWWAHVWLVHAFVLGAISVDGFGYRGYALVELLQHGDVGASRITDWSVPRGELGARCAGLANLVRREPDVLFVDEQDATAGCARTCVIHEPVICAAWRIAPGLESFR